MTLLIRPADLSDAPELRRMIHALAAHHKDRATISLAEIYRDLFTEHSWARALVAAQGARLVGYAILVPKWRGTSGERALDLHHLFVDPSARGQRVGTRLIAAARARAREMGAGQLIVGTAPDNHAAQAFYQSLGMDQMPNPGPRYVMAS